MAETPSTTRRRAVVLGAVAALVAAAGAAMVVLPYREAAPEVAVPAGEAAPSGSNGEPTASDGAGPRFDVVRVAPDGVALVAGRATPGARVTVRAGDADVAAVETGASGEFVATFQVPAAATPQALSLASDGDAGEATASRETVLLLPPPGASSGEGGTDGAGADAAAAPGTGEPEDGPATGAVTGPRAVAPEIAVTALLGEDGVEVLETEPPPADAQRPVSLASISYGEEGRVALEGFGTAGAEVRVYVDGTHAVEGEIDAFGRWRLALAGISAGVYRLRIDEIAPDGQVTSRVETPFQRDFPELVPAPGDGEGSITVQPGNNLWTIAQQHYGQGTLYTQIFTANADLIRDPDLIHPGQIFVLPTGEDASTPVEGPRPNP